MRSWLSVKRQYGGNFVDNYLLLAGLIEAHPNREVIGRSRLQKTVRLAQRIGVGTNYTFSIQSYGPYSEELRSDVTTIKNLGLGSEECCASLNDIESFVIRANPQAHNASIDPFRACIETLAKIDLKVLDLAATYDAFREMGSDHTDALRRLRAKKGPKCDNETLGKAISLLATLGLPAAEHARHATH
jgi:uncharacterized protein YwgA